MSSPEPIQPPPWGVPAPLGPAGEFHPPDLNGRVDLGDRTLPVIAAELDPVAAAYSAGFEAGVAEGRVHAVAELAPVQTTFRGLIGSLERDQLAARQGAAENIYALALTVARWLFQREVEHDVAVIESLIRRAVSLLPAGVPIEVRANPTDLTALGSHLDLREPDGRPLSIHWIADPAIERGSFTLASLERLVDGRTDVALRALYDRLVGG